MHTAICALNLYVETLTCETGLGYANFLPDLGTNPFVDERDGMYWDLLLDEKLVAEQKREERLMRQHPSYVPENRQRDIAEVVIKNALESRRRYEQALADIRSGKFRVG